MILGLTLLTVGILSAVPYIRVTETPNGDVVDQPFRTTSNLSLAAMAQSSGAEPSASELNRKPSEDVWTVPVGLGLGKVVKFGRLPVKIQLAVQYMPVHPRISGQEWNVQLQVTPVIPKLIKGVLFQ
jgi:hypothetical protein